MAAIVAFLVASCLTAPQAWAQEETSLWQREPFDRITLTEEHGNKVFEIFPIEVDGERRPKDPKHSTKLRVRLLDQPDRQFDVAWKNIAKLELFEEMILAKAEELTRDDELNQAYDHYLFLLKNYPKLPGLERSLQNYLYRNVVVMFVQERYHAALSAVEELYAQNPNFNQSLIPAMARTFDKVIEAYVSKEDWHSARTIIARLARQYRQTLADVRMKWEEELSDRAAVHRDAAVNHLNQKEFLEAHEALREMVKIWPRVPEGRETAERVTREYPLVVVGVSQLATSHNPRSLTSFAARRSGRLLHRLLSEFQGHGPEGGQYECPIGTMRRSGDEMQLIFDLKSDYARAGSEPLTGYDISRDLLDLATPGGAYQPAWSALTSQIAVERVMRVRVFFRQPHVLPQALLQSPFSPPSGEKTFGSYVIAKEVREPDRPHETQYIINEAHPFTQLGQPAVIIERQFKSPEAAAAALERGDVDVIDWAPAHLLGDLRRTREIRVAPYAAPTVHLLIPNPNKVYTANRTFRRAILLAIARQVNLDQVILKGKPPGGCRLLSGPFPAGVVPDDPMAYAYDESIDPRAYNPVLASVLAVLAQNELSQAAKERKEPAPKFKSLVLGHPATETAHQICRAIEYQLNKINLKCERKELPVELYDDLRQWAGPPQRGDSPSPQATAQIGSQLGDEIDLLYVEAAQWDPIVDARRLLGEDGVAGAENPYIRLALRQIDTAQNWRQARSQLLELHRLVHNELTVIPLWQVAGHLAYRRGLENVGDRPVTLYHNVEAWRIDPASRAYGDET